MLSNKKLFYWDYRLNRWSRILGDGSEIALTPRYNLNSSTWDEVMGMLHIPKRERIPANVHELLPKEVLSLIKSRTTAGSTFETFLVNWVYI